jgi:hypothetical protein
MLTETEDEARRAVRLQLRSAGLDVEPSCPDAHRASIEASVSGVDPALRLPAHQHAALREGTPGSVIGRSFLLPPCNLSLDELRHAVVQVLVLQDSNQLGIRQSRDANSDFAVAWHAQFLQASFLRTISRSTEGARGRRC